MSDGEAACELERLEEQMIQALHCVRLAEAAVDCLAEATRGHDFDVHGLEAWLTLLALDSQAILHARQTCLALGHGWINGFRGEIKRACRKHRSEAKARLKGRRPFPGDREVVSAYARLFPAAKGRGLQGVDVDQVGDRLESDRLKMTRDERAHPGLTAVAPGNVKQLQVALARDAIRDLQDVMRDLYLVMLRTHTDWPVGTTWVEAYRLAEHLVDTVLLRGTTRPARDRLERYEKLHTHFEADGERFGPRFNSPAYFMYGPTP